MAEPQSTDQPKRPNLFDVFRSLSDAYAPPPPTRTERAVSSLAYCVGCAIGYSARWGRFVIDAAKDGYRDQRGE